MPSSGTTSVHRDDSVSIGETPVGKGVFSERSYSSNAVIGEITGDVVKNCPSGSRYSFEIDDRTQLEPLLKRTDRDIDQAIYDKSLLSAKL